MGHIIDISAGTFDGFQGLTAGWSIDRVMGTLAASDRAHRATTTRAAAAGIDMADVHTRAEALGGCSLDMALDAMIDAARRARR